MIEELEDAGIAFRAALDRYLSVCSKIGEPSLLRDIPQRHLDAIHLEVAQFPAYKLKLRQVETTISRIRNCLPKVVSIASLPPETLAHIFHLVAKPCDLIVPNHEDAESGLNSDSDSDSSNAGTNRRDKRAWGLNNYPSHIDNVTRVCSNWRQIAIACPTLWTHIDIISHGLLYIKFLARAKTYAARAAQLPLELHFADAIPFGYDETSFSRFLSSVFNRIQSLNITVVHGWRSFHNLIFTELFALRESRPIRNIFTKLTTSFTMADDNIDEFVGWPSSANYLHFTTLHLRGLFPTWDSRAYLDLVDLRLTASRDERWIDIPELQLRRILVASPRLRIFHFALGIKDWQPEHESVPPVRLDDLEILSIRTERDECSTFTKPGHLLRLIAPGSKPLQLSIWHNFLVYDPTDDDIHQDDFSPKEIARFFERSNINKFRFNNESFRPDKLLHNATDLEDLVLETYILPPCSDDPISRITPITPRLKSLTLQNCFLSLDRLEVLLQQYPPDRLVLSRCNWTFDGPFQSWDQVREVSELLERYPATKAIFESSYANVSWDLID